MPLGARWTRVQMPALLLTHKSALSQPFPSQSLRFLTCIMGTGACEIGDCEMPLWYLARGRHCVCSAGVGGSPCSWKRLPLGVLQAGLDSPFCHLQDPGVAQLEGIVESVHLAPKMQRRLTAGPGSSGTPGQNLDLNPGPPESQGRCQTPRLTLKQPGNGKHQNLLALRLIRKPWQSSHPPLTVRLSQAELKRFIGFVGCCPAPHSPGFHCHSCHLHCFFPISPGSVFPTTFHSSQASSGLSVGGPETLLAHPSRITLLMKHIGEPSLPLVSQSFTEGRPPPVSPKENIGIN